MVTIRCLRGNTYQNNNRKSESWGASGFAEMVGWILDELESKTTSIQPRLKIFRILNLTIFLGYVPRLGQELSIHYSTRPSIHPSISIISS
jgi:hypothetical protein